MKRNIHFIEIFFVFALYPGLSLAQDRSITLKVSVTNTSLEQSQDIDVKLDLPKELTKRNIISSDGLKVEYDDEQKALVARDKVALQRGETTFFSIVTSDVWLIPEDEMRSLRNEMDSLRLLAGEYYVQQQIEGLMNDLDKILEQQKEKVEDAAVHIQEYRENLGKYGEIKKRLLTIRKLTDKKQAQKRGFSPAIYRWILRGCGILGLAVIFFLAYKNKSKIIKRFRYFQMEKYIKIAQLFNPADISCHLLIDQENGMLAERADFFPRSSAGQYLCLFLEDSYRAQTVLEIKIPLVSFKKHVVLRGSIVWQRKMADHFTHGKYLTGIKINEISQDDFQKLKNTIEAHADQ